MRRLTGGDEVRTSATRGIAERLRAQLRKREHVYAVAQTVLPDHGGKRMVDLVLEGREDVVLADLAEGRIDPRDVLATGRLENHGW